MSDFTGDAVATASQHEQELAALELISHPTVKAAYRSVAEKWLGRAKASDAMRERFDDAFAEVMFSAAVWSSNQDKLRPKVSCITRIGHPVAGHPIPGSRWGIDNPDSVYRVIPISGDERYEIHGRVGANRMTENYFTLWDANMGTVAVLNGRTMEVDSDGSFTVTVDSDPANDRPNHVQTTPEAHEFYIRDVLLNWDRDDPNHLTVQRLGAEPTTAPRTLDEQADATAAMMAYFADFTGKLSHGVYKMAPNNFNLGVVGRSGRRHAKPGVRDGQVRVEPRRGVRRRRGRRWGRILHRPAEQYLGHHTGHRRSHRKPQQGAVGAE